MSIEREMQMKDIPLTLSDGTIIKPGKKLYKVDIKQYFSRHEAYTGVSRLKRTRTETVIKTNPVNRTFVTKDSDGLENYYTTKRERSTYRDCSDFFGSMKSVKEYIKSLHQEDINYLNNQIKQMKNCIAKLEKRTR